MDKYAQFKEHISHCLERFKEIDKRETIRLVSHLDADGISSCSLMVKALNTDNRKYSLSIVPSLSEEVISELAREPYQYFVFTDLGSGALSLLNKYLADRQIFVLDHHEIEDCKVNSHITHVNPHLFGIDGGKEISGAGVAFMFIRSLSKTLDDFAHIALIGATGDIQEDGNGFLTLNKEILDIAVKRDKVKVLRGLRIFGAQTRSLHKVLEYCTDPFIPGVSGSESGTIQFLQEIGVDARNGKDWRKIVHLDAEELKKLVSGIILRRMGEDRPEDVLGNVYILNDEEKESPFRDIKEFSTLLNACGRMDNASLGIGACLGDKKTKEKALRNLLSYKRLIMNSMRWYESHEDSDNVKKGDGYVIINAEDQVKSTVIGTMASILSKSNDLKKGTLILSLADALDGNYKVSLRVCGNVSVDLRNLASLMAASVDGEAGGHEYAAGAVISDEKVSEFLSEAEKILSKQAMTEMIH